MKKKLLHVIESAGGGALQYVLDICNVLPHEEWDIEVVFSRRNVTPADLSQYVGSHIKLTEIMMSREISPRNDYDVYRYLYGKFRETAWDTIHLHSSKAGAIGRLAARGLKSPIVYTPHGYSFYQQDISRIKRSFYLSVEKLLDRILPVQILVSSLKEYEDAIKISRDADRVARIANSVPLQSGRRLEPCENEFLMITVGRLTPAKNPQMMLDVIEEVYQRIPRMRFIWIGDGEQKEYVVSEAERRGLPVEITGWLERNEIELWYRSCHVYLQASLWEGLPLSVLEAMSYGCAIVVSDIPAHRELIKNGTNGVIAGNLEDYTSGIVKLKEYPEFRATLGAKSRQIVAVNNSLDQFALALKEFYQSNIRVHFERGLSFNCIPSNKKTI